MGDFGDNRKTERITGQFNVDVISDKQEEANSICYSKDISEDGISIITSMEPVPRTKMTVGFNLNFCQARWIIPSEVVWVRPARHNKLLFEAGFNFLESERKRELLRKYIY